MHMVFVDDEPNILHGLRRTLRSMRGKWNMSFFESGQEVLNHLETNPCDILISDMYMPGMNGVELLTEVKKNYPGIIRFILSGQASQELIYGSIRNAHRFLSKPCSIEQLKEAIESSLLLSSILKCEKIREYIASLISLPSLSDSYVRLMNELKSFSPSLDEIATIIQNDIGMTAKILHIVNSAFFGISKNYIISIKEAVNLLGITNLKTIAMNVGMFLEFNPKIHSCLDLQAINRHSNEVGLLAKMVVDMDGYDEYLRDTAHMTGLLHNIGKIILSTFDTSKYHQVIELMKKEKIPCWEAENQIFGFNHMQAGAFLLSLWGFPTTVVSAILGYKEPAMLLRDEFDLPTLLYLTHTLISYENAYAAQDSCGYDFNIPPDKQMLQWHKMYRNYKDLKEH